VLLPRQHTEPLLPAASPNAPGKRSNTTVAWTTAS